MVEKGFDMLDAPIKRVAALDVPIPFSKPLELAVIPDERRIEAAIRAVLG
jgi:pyruvate dehydrogenase E1 component beta subunit